LTKCRGRGTNLCVHLERQHNFWRTIPSCGHILRHQPSLFPVCRRVLHASSKPKIADLKVTVGVEKKIGRFEVTMDNVCTVNGFESAEGLIDEILVDHT
jgi:hypothetical protein